MKRGIKRSRKDERSLAEPKSKLSNIQMIIDSDNFGLFNRVHFSIRNLKLIFLGECPELQKYILKYRGNELIRIFLENGNSEFIANRILKEIEDGSIEMDENVFSKIEDAMEYASLNYQNPSKKHVFLKMCTTIFKVLKIVGYNCSEKTLEYCYEGLPLDQFMNLFPPSCIISEKLYGRIMKDLSSTPIKSTRSTSILNKFRNNPLIMMKYPMGVKNNFVAESITTMKEFDEIFKSNDVYQVPKGLVLAGLNLKRIAINYTTEMLPLFLDLYPDSLHNKEFLAFCLLTYYFDPEKFKYFSYKRTVNGRRIVIARRRTKIPPYDKINGVEDLPIFMVKDNYNMNQFCNLIRNWGDNDMILMGIRNMIILNGLNDLVEGLIENLFNYQFIFENVNGYCASCLHNFNGGSKIAIKVCEMCNLYVHLECLGNFDYSQCRICFNEPVFQCIKN